MATIDYKEKYEAALAVAQETYNTQPMYREWLESMFHELRGSEDERIRKALMQNLKERFGTKGNMGEGLDMPDVLTWLEKQGMSYTQKDVDDAYLKGVTDTKNEIEKQYKATYQIRKDIATFIFNYRGDIKDRAKWMDYLGIKVSLIEKQGEQKPADKVEPKFHNGEWITNGDYTWKIVDVKPLDYILQSQDGNVVDDTISHVDGQFHSFTIEDAKNGDVLHSIGFDSDCIFIFNGIDNWKFDEPTGDKAVATGYCCLTVSVVDNMEFGIQGPDCIEVDTVKPATKIQRDLLFQKMKDAGYEWDAEKKKLKKIEQMSSWSEEDEQYLLVCKNALAKYQKTDKWDASIISRWLEFLKDRVQPLPKQEWSEEVESVISLLKSMAEEQERDYCPHNANHLRKAAQYLETFRPQNTWKPSDEMLEALYRVIPENVMEKSEDEILLDKLYQGLKYGRVLSKD